MDVGKNAPEDDIPSVPLELDHNKAPRRNIVQSYLARKDSDYTLYNVPSIGEGEGSAPITPIADFRHDDQATPPAPKPKKTLAIEEKIDSSIFKLLRSKFDPEENKPVRKDSPTELPLIDASPVYLTADGEVPAAKTPPFAGPNEFGCQTTKQVDEAKISKYATDGQRVVRDEKTDLSTVKALKSKFSGEEHSQKLIKYPTAKLSTKNLPPIAETEVLPNPKHGGKRESVLSRRQPSENVTERVSVSVPEGEKIDRSTFKALLSRFRSERHEPRHVRIPVIKESPESNERPMTSKEKLVSRPLVLETDLQCDGPVTAVIPRTKLEKITETFVTSVTKDETFYCSAVDATTMPEKANEQKPDPQDEKINNKTFRSKELEKQYELWAPNGEQLDPIKFSSEAPKQAKGLKEPVLKHEKSDFATFRSEMPKRLIKLRPVSRYEKVDAENFAPKHPDNVTEVRPVPKDEKCDYPTFRPEMPEKLVKLRLVPQDEKLDIPTFASKPRDEVAEVKPVPKDEKSNYPAFRSEMPKKLTELRPAPNDEKLETSTFASMTCVEVAELKPVPKDKKSDCKTCGSETPKKVNEVMPEPKVEKLDIAALTPNRPDEVTEPSPVPKDGKSDYTTCRTEPPKKVNEVMPVTKAEKLDIAAFTTKPPDEVTEPEPVPKDKKSGYATFRLETPKKADELRPVLKVEKLDIATATGTGHHRSPQNTDSPLTKLSYIYVPLESAQIKGNSPEFVPTASKRHLEDRTSPGLDLKPRPTVRTESKAVSKDEKIDRSTFMAIRSKFRKHSRTRRSPQTEFGKDTSTTVTGFIRPKGETNERNYPSGNSCISKEPKAVDRPTACVTAEASRTEGV